MELQNNLYVPNPDTAANIRKLGGAKYHKFGFNRPVGIQKQEFKRLSATSNSGFALNEGANGECDFN